MRPLATLEIPSVTEYIDIVDAAAQHIGKAYGRLDDDDLFFLGISTRELVANAIKHGNKGDVAKPVRTDFYLDGSSLKISVTDRSPKKFDPESMYRAEGDEALSNHGRGYMIIEQTMDGIEYEWLDPGNRITIRRDIQPAASISADERDLREQRL